MLLVTFSYKSIRYFIENFLYLYMSSILLGGSLYFLNIEFSYKNEGLVFFHKGLSINFILLLIFGPVILYIYIRQLRGMKLHFSQCHKVDLYLEDGTILKLNGYLDTGNKLYDPYSNRPIVLVYSNKIKFDYEKGLLVPFMTLQEKGIIKCVKIPKMIIDDNKVFKNVLIGKSNKPFQIDGIDCILHSEYMEG